MNAIIEFIDLHVSYSPIVFFILLILAGCNVPISEDVIILIGGILASRNHEYRIFIYLGIFWGAYLGDIISFYIGRFLGNKIFKNSKKENKLLHKVSYYYGQYGVITLIFGRFIPFGVRNAIFMSAGMGNMRPIQFFIFDFIAALISVTLYFVLSYKIGKSFEIILSKIKIIIFVIFIIILVLILIYYFIRLRSRKLTNLQD